MEEESHQDIVDAQRGFKDAVPVQSWSGAVCIMSKGREILQCVLLILSGSFRDLQILLW